MLTWDQRRLLSQLLPSPTVKPGAGCGISQVKCRSRRTQADFPSLNFTRHVYSVLYGLLSLAGILRHKVPHGPALGDACDPVPPISLLCLLLVMLFKNIEAHSAESIFFSERNKRGTRTGQQNYRCVWGAGSWNQTGSDSCFQVCERPSSVSATHSSSCTASAPA